MNFRNINWSILIILIFGILIKLSGVFLLPLYHDVGWYRPLTLFNDRAYMNLALADHPPLGYYFYIAALKIFGIKDYIVRVVPFVFSIIEISLIYWLSKKWYNLEIANTTLILWSLTFFAYLNSLSPETDGSITGVFSIILFYFFYKFCYDFNKKDLLFAGLFYGLIMLIKLRGVLFIIPLCLFLLMKTKNLKKTFLACLKLFFIGMAILSLFPITMYLENPSGFLTMSEKIIQHNVRPSEFFYKFTHPLIYLQTIVVLSPIYLFLLWIGLKNIWLNFADTDLLLIIWFLSLLILLLLFLPPIGIAAAYPRYISFLLPPLIIISAKSLITIKSHFSNKKIFFILLASSSLCIITHIINEKSQNYWFYASAAMGVYKITQLLLIFYLGTAFLLWFLYWFFINDKSKNICITLFFIITLAFNFHFMFEPIVDQTHPKIINDLIEFYNQNQIKKPLFVWAEDLAFYLGSNGLNIKTFTNPQLRAYAERIGYNAQGHFNFDLNDAVSMNELKTKGGTVFTLYLPYKYALQKDLNRQKEDNYLRTNCKLLKESIYKTGRGEAWEC